MAMANADCGAALGAGYAEAQMRYQQQYASYPFMGKPPSMHAPPSRPAWAITLGVGPDAKADEIKRAYHALAVLNHPDHGGSDEAMTAINAAYEQAMKSRA
jgi:DnaJ-like protein